MNILKTGRAPRRKDNKKFSRHPFTIHLSTHLISKCTLAILVIFVGFSTKCVPAGFVFFVKSKFSCIFEVKLFSRFVVKNVFNVFS